MFSRVRHDEVRWSVYRSARSSQLNRRCVRACVRAGRAIDTVLLFRQQARWPRLRARSPRGPAGPNGTRTPTPNPKARTQRRDLDDFVIMSAETLEEMVQACESGFSNLALSSQVKSFKSLC